MEFWDIYDKDKKPTGRTMKRNDWCLKDGEYHLTVLGVVARPDGTFLITKRVMTKAWAPGCWEVSGGAAQAGEESYEAVLREVKEETGLDVEMQKAAICLLINVRIRVREIIILWMCIASSWISMTRFEAADRRNRWIYVCNSGADQRICGRRQISSL